MIFLTGAEPTMLLTGGGELALEIMPEVMDAVSDTSSLAGVPG